MPSGAIQIALPVPKVETITPEVAMALLAANTHNRKLRRAHVESLAATISSGEWTLNGATVKVANDGMLIDGQHRLEAVVLAGRSIETVVVRGLRASSQETVDTGRRRQLADVLAIEGYPDSRALSAAANVLYRYRVGARDITRGIGPTPEQALALLEGAPDLVDSVRVARAVATKIGGPVGVFAALHSVFSKADPVPTVVFFEDLKMGARLEVGDPVLHLRDLIQRPRKDRHYSHTPYYIAALTIKAFNYRREKRTIGLLSFRANERFPVVAVDAEAVQP